MHKLICIFTLLCFSLSSCCSITRGTTQNVAIQSEPTGANITIDGYVCGITPQSFELKRNYPHTVVIEKQGYKPQYFDLKSGVGGKVASNALLPIGGALAGAGFGLALTEGTMAGLGGALILMSTGIGCAVGAAIGVFGTGVDLCSGSARNLSNTEIYADLDPYQN